MLSNAKKTSTDNPTFISSFFFNRSFDRVRTLSNPQHTTWQNVGIVFCDGHTVSISYRGKKIGKFNYSELGMVNRKSGDPNKQWELLETFANNKGKLDARSSDTNSFRQQKWLLCKQLKDFLTIDDPPIVWDNIFRTYTCRFCIQPDT